MSDAWWSLPGPGSALERIEHALQDDRSSVIAMPECSGPSPLEQIVRTVHPNEWVQLSRGEFKDRSPAELLVEKFCTDVPSTVVPDEHALLNSECSNNLFICLKIDDNGIWESWRSFLNDMERLGKDIPWHQRPLFLIELRGAGIGNPVETGVTVTWHEWSNVISRADMGLYVALLSPREGEAHHEHSVRTSIVSALSLSDPELAKQLVRLPLEELLEPQEVLLEYAEERGWDHVGYDPEEKENWILGKISKIDEQQHWHSAALAASSNLELVTRRIWQGQLVSLFPLVEELRLPLIAELRRTVKAPGSPLDTDTATDNELKDFEIGALFDLVGKLKRDYGYRVIEEWLCDVTWALWRIRNDLAHLEIVSIDLIRDRNIRKLARVRDKLPDLTSR